MKTYKDLIVWQKSMDLVADIYRVTRLFPIDERFGLVNQMRRASVSIPSNIAEGYARKNRKENAQFINIAFGSGTELETQITIAKRLLFVPDPDREWSVADKLLQEVLSMLYRYRESLYLQ